MPDEEQIVFNAEIEIDVEAKKAVASIKRVQSQLDELEKTASKASGPVKKMAEDIANAFGVAFRRMSAPAREIKNSTENVTKVIDQEMKAMSERQKRGFADMVNDVEKNLVVRMRSILGDNAKLIDDYVLKADASIGEIGKTYKEFIDEIEKQRALFAAGKGKIKEPEQVVIAQILKRAQEEMKAAGLSSQEITNQLYTNYLHLLKRASTITEQIPQEAVKGFRAKAGQLKEIPQILNDAIYNKFNEKMQELPLSVSTGIITTIKEMNKTGNLLANASMETAKIVFKPLSSLPKEAAGAIGDLGNEMKAFSKVLGTSLSKTSDILFDSVIMPMIKLPKDIGKAWSESEETMKRLSTGIFSGIDISIKKALGDTINSVKSGAGQLVSPLIESMRDIAFLMDKNLLGPIVASVENQFDSMANSLKSAGELIGQSISSGLAKSSDAIEAARDKIKKTLTPIAATMAGVGISVLDFGIDAKKKIESQLKPIIATMENIGKDAARKLAAGISLEVGVYKKAASDVVTALNPVAAGVAGVAKRAALEFKTSMAVIGDQLAPYKIAARKIADAWKPLDDYMWDLGSRAGTKLKDSLLSIGDKVGVFTGPIKDIISAWSPLAEQMLNVGTMAANSLVDGITRQVQISTPVISAAMTSMAKATGDAISDQFKYVMGGLGDVLTRQSKNEKMRRAAARADELGMIQTYERQRREMNYYGVDLENNTQKTAHQMRVLRQTFADTAKNVAASIDNMFSGNQTFRQSVDGLAIAFQQMDRVYMRQFGLTENMATVQEKYAKAIKVATGALSGYKRENEILDPTMLRMADQTDLFSDRLKEQSQVFVKGVQMERQAIQEKMEAIANYASLYGKVSDVEQGKIAITEDAREKLADKTIAAIEQLKKIGATNIFGDLEGDLESIIQQLGAFGTGFQTQLKDTLEDSFESADETVTQLDDHIKSMRLNFPKALSMFDRAIQDVEGNSKHFLTTLRDGGKISTERLQDMLLPIQRLAGEMDNMRNLGIISPEQEQVWENINRNLLTETENFALLVQRARVVEARKEKLVEVSNRVTGAIKGIGRAATENIPIIGTKAKLSSDQVDKLRSATQNVQSSTRNLSFTLGNIDPVFNDIINGAQGMGQIFGSTIDGMAQVSSVKSASIVKSLSMIKIIAAGIVGAVGGVIISTGKLAAEVTTLGLTMRTVGKNVGVPVPYLENLVDVLKDTGITTRESMSAITQWMRAGLSFEWTDSIQNTTFSIKDLARASQELAVAMGENSSETFARFIDFIQSGNSNLLKTVGIMKTASQMQEEYAKATKKTVEQLTIREKQEALISGLLRETSKLQGVYTEAMTTASKQLGSMKRYIEELRLEWGKQFEPILVVAIQKFNDFLKMLTKIPDDTKKTISSILAIAGGVSALVLGIGFLLPKLRMLFTIMGTGFSAALSPVGLLIGALVLLAPHILKMLNLFQGGEGGIEGMSNAIGKAADGFGKFGEVIKPITDWFSNFFQMVGVHVSRISYLIGKFVEDVRVRIESFKSENPELLEFLESIKSVFGDLFSTIWKIVDNVLTAIEALLNQDWDAFLGGLAEAGKNILSWMYEFFNQIVLGAFEWGKNLVSSFISGFVQKARQAIPRAMSGVGSMIASFLEGHSPAKVGPLSSIDKWGGGLMGSFERGLKQKKILFDEDMFTGMASLNTKAKYWGDNIVSTFAMGIAGKATTALVPTMNYVGDLIAQFLEGHSPPPEGKLAGIQNWGRTAFETFLAGFKMADFSILDTALDLVGERLNNLVTDSKSSASIIAKAMTQVREAVGGAIFSARMTGGPLDLSGLREMVVGSLGKVAQDIAAVLEANFAALEAAAGVEALQEQISAAREARKKAMDAVQERIESIREQIEDAEDSIKELEEQMEKEFELRAKAAGILVDEKLMDALKRELDRANVEVQRAQRRIERIRGVTGKYGANILTWEEINANVQLDLAKKRQEQVQEQINYQEELQRQAEELREKIEEEYKGQFDALNAQIELMQKRAEEAEDRLKELQKADKAASSAEDAQLAAAQKHAKQLEAHAAFLSKALEERMKAEKEAADARRAATTPEGEGGDGQVYPDVTRRKPKRDRQPDIGRGIEEPDTSGFFDSARIAVENWATDISGWWEGFKETPVGKLLTTVPEELGEIIDRLAKLAGDLNEKVIKPLWEFIVKLATGIGDLILKFSGASSWSEFWQNKLLGLSAVIEMFSEFVQIVIDILDGLLTGDWSTLIEDVEEFADAFLRVISPDLSFEGLQNSINDFANSLKPAAKKIGNAIGSVVGFFKDIGKGAGDAWNTVSTAIGKILKAIGDLGKNISNAIKGVIEAILSPFRKAKDELVGNSIIPEMVDDIVDIIGDLPDAILRIAGALFNAAVELGLAIYNGISSKVTDISNAIGGWLSAVAGRIGDSASAFFSNAVTVATKIYDAINGKISDIGTAIGGWLSNVAGKIGDAGTTFYNNAFSLASQIYNAISNRIGNIGTSIAGWLISVASSISGAASSFYNNAVNVANQIYNGFRDIFLNSDTGIIARVSSWFTSILNTISGFGTSFYGAAWTLGNKIYNGIVTAISTLGTFLNTFIKGVWNNHLRLGFNVLLDGVESGVNSIIALLNSAWEAIGSPGWIPGFPITPISIDPLPELAVGGIVMDDMVAKLHAGEIVLPLDRLDSLLRNMNIAPVPAFAPIMNFYPGSSPQQVMPAIHEAYDWYIEENRRGT